MDISPVTSSVSLQADILAASRAKALAPQASNDSTPATPVASSVVDISPLAHLLSASSIALIPDALLALQSPLAPAPATTTAAVAAQAQTNTAVTAPPAPIAPLATQSTTEAAATAPTPTPNAPVATPSPPTANSVDPLFSAGNFAVAQVTSFTTAQAIAAYYLAGGLLEANKPHVDGAASLPSNAIIKPVEEPHAAVRLEPFA
jgi:hypothetical protein